MLNSFSNHRRSVALSALQHYHYCPRQCALIHNEQSWSENFFTASGRQLHERVDGGEMETRKGVRFERSVEVSAPTLGVHGKLDLLEIELNTDNLIPVEYKRGQAKPDQSDKVQLCAQALCLEEMRDINIPEAALWYWKTRTRITIPLDEPLRHTTLMTIEAVHELLAEGNTPRATYGTQCKACSLYDLCNPKLLKDRSEQHNRRLFT